MYAFLNHSSRCLYKNYIQVGRLLRNLRGFRDRVLHFQLSPTLSRKDNSMLTPRYWFPILFSLSVVLKYKLPVPVSIFFKCENGAFSKIKKLVLVIYISERQIERSLSNRFQRFINFCSASNLL